MIDGPKIGYFGPKVGPLFQRVVPKKGSKTVKNGSVF